MPNQPDNSVELHDGWLRVHFPPSVITAGGDARPVHADYHYEWLRGLCDADRHPLTGERIVDASEIAASIRPLSAEVEAPPGGDAALVVRWDEAGGRKSRYALSWLLTHAYALGRHSPPPPPSELSAITMRAADCADDEALIDAALLRTIEHGAVLVRGYGQSHGAEERGAAPEDTEALIDAFARTGLLVRGTHFGRIEDLRTDNTTNKNTDQLGYTDAAIEAHTDQPFLEDPPRYQLLHCIRQADCGGENYVVDGLAAARFLGAIDEEALRVLETTPVHFHRKQRAFESLVVSPILSAKADGSFLIRYSYFTMAPQQLPFAKMNAWYRAYRRFAEIVRNPAHQYRMRLLPGDFLLYDNHRMLHARTGFSGARWVRGVYFDAKTPRET